jgi:Na+-translocating ferredoxin:NAD+ oxidoreductase subunit G
MREISKLILVLGLFGVVSASSLAYVRAALAPRIERQSDLHARGPALARLFVAPAAEVLANRVVIESEGATYPVFYHREAGKVVGLAIETIGRGGYGGDIVLMVAVDLRTGKLTGTEIVSHRESPSFGAQIEKPTFRKQWHGLSATTPVALRADGGRIDAISGATFSSRAMIDGTNRAIAVVRDHEAEILQRIAAATGATP